MKQRRAQKKSEEEEYPDRGRRKTQRRRENRNNRRQDRQWLRRPPSPWEMRGRFAQREDDEDIDDGYEWWGEFDNVHRLAGEE